MSKVTIIGAGSVGGLSAMRITEASLADVVLIDIIKPIAIGKSLDIEDASIITKTNRLVIGSDDFSLIEGSDIVVICAGFARKPGMTRQDLLEKNAEVIRGISHKLKDLKKKPIIIVVTNPVDILTYLILKLTNFDKKRVIGLGTSLDTARFINLIKQELKVSHSHIEALVIGAHSEKMIPLVSKAKVRGKALSSILTLEKIKTLIKLTQERGLAIVSNLGSGSAYFAPSSAILEMVRAIVLDEKHLLSASVYLDGEYNLKDICMGVPVIMGKNGVEEILKLQLTEEENKELKKSAEEIRKCLISA